MCLRAGINPFRTAVPFWGQTSQISSIFVPRRDCGSKGVKIVRIYPSLSSAWCSSGSASSVFVYDAPLIASCVFIRFAALVLMGFCRGRFSPTETSSRHELATGRRSCKPTLPPFGALISPEPDPFGTFLPLGGAETELAAGGAHQGALLPRDFIQH